VAMCATQFLTQRQLMMKNMPPDALSGPYAQQQKMLLYVLPVVFAVGGVAFPLGVLIYWTTSNLWTMGQQFYVIRKNPAPGTPAFKAKQERDAKHGKSVTEDPLKELEEPHEKPVPRQQPKRQSRNGRRKQGGAKTPAEDPPAEAEQPAAENPSATPKPSSGRKPSQQARNQRPKSKSKKKKKGKKR
jgi:YidC/Oxa1 family membrane protein insertase